MFQFHKGSINTQIADNTAYCKHCFNSIKVQLILKISLKSSDMLKLFQFHKGSINTHPPNRHKQMEYVVSIP